MLLSSAFHDISMPGKSGAPIVGSNAALVSALGWSGSGELLDIGGGCAGWRGIFDEVALAPFDEAVIL